jgi:FkbH-like protein
MALGDPAENIKNLLCYPFDFSAIMRKKRALIRELGKQPELLPKKIAILGGFTADSIRDLLELFLMKNGIKPIFFESDFNKYYEEAIFSSAALDEFKPDIVFICTAHRNIRNFPKIMESESATAALADSELQLWKSIAAAIKRRFNCMILQNNFDFPPDRSLGNLDGTKHYGRMNFINGLNLKLAEMAAGIDGYYLININYLSCQVGFEKWHERTAWNAYKSAIGLDALPALAHNVSKVIASAMGRAKKCLILDLDNTLWGGVIGDDGLSGISIGPDSPVGASYSDFQQYCKSLKDRGILLAVCSKNEENTAQSGFDHPMSLLKLEDFSVFKANWKNKVENICAIASELSLGLDSFVFIDDNPVERDIIRKNLPEVEVPEVDGDPSKSIEFLDRECFFEPVSISAEDVMRNQYYSIETTRGREIERFVDYSDYLKSLEMTAEIGKVLSGDLDRVAQLTNKTNQFNLTTKRYTLPEMTAISKSASHIMLSGRLKDRFGDSGLITLVIGEKRANELHVELWLMSCRVIRRGMEMALWGELIRSCRKEGISVIYGYYRKTPKNAMVASHYADFGFSKVIESKDSKNEWDSVWRMSITDSEHELQHYIEVVR